MEYYVCPIVIFYLGCKTRFAGGLRVTSERERSVYRACFQLISVIPRLNLIPHANTERESERESERERRTALVTFYVMPCALSVVL